MNSDKIKDFLMGIFFFVFSLLLVYLLTLPKRQALLAQESAAPAAEPTQTSLIIAEPTADPLPEESAGPELPPPPDIDINSWEFTYVGSKQSVGFSYAPELSVVKDQYLDSRITQAAIDFFDAAKEAGYKVYIGVGYRNSEYIMYHFEKAMLEYGSAYEAAKHAIAPGCSEHCTGLAFDITDKDLYAANYYDMHDEEMGESEAYKWMAEHCAEYGFIVRYPEGKEDIYGKGCYTGHFRYVGVEAAKYIMENDLCLEEFIALYK